MFSSQKRIFAGKQKLQYEPFCPYISNESGFMSLHENRKPTYTRSGTAFDSRPTFRDGKRYV